MNKSYKFSLLFVFFLLLSMSVNMLSAESQPDYVCYRVNEPPHIDGRLDESFWQNVPDMEFREIATGSDLPYPAKAKMVWDDKYLYQDV